MATVFKTLIVDDDEYDREMLMHVIGHCPSLKVVSQLGGGEFLIKYLSGEGLYRDRETYPLPDLLLLDARMPCCDGNSVLSWLKEHPVPGLKVVIMSGAPNTRACQELLAMGAHDYYFKTRELRQMQETMKQIETHLMHGDYHSASRSVNRPEMQRERLRKEFFE